MPKMSGRRSEKVWRELLARQACSGLSAQAFCQRERLNVNTFYGWRLRTVAADSLRVVGLDSSAATPERRTSQDLGR
jgi:hypothetical protein